MMKGFVVLALALAAVARANGRADRGSTELHYLPRGTTRLVADCEVQYGTLAVNTYLVNQQLTFLIFYRVHTALMSQERFATPCVDSRRLGFLLEPGISWIIDFVTMILDPPS